MAIHQQPDTGRCSSGRESLASGMRELSDEAGSFLKRTMMLDVMLYDWATLRFNQHLLAAGECAVKAEVTSLRKLNHRLATTCPERCSKNAKGYGRHKCDECDPCMRVKYKRQGDLADYAARKQQSQGYPTKPSGMMWSDGGSRCHQNTSGSFSQQQQVSCRSFL